MHYVLQYSFIWITMFRPTGVHTYLRDFSVCHDDFSLNPPDGLLPLHTFKWVAFVQYIHVTTNLPHQSKAPRVVLIHQQHVLGTAKDLFSLPRNYKLGNIIFGDYEREESECGLTKSQIKLGIKCGPAFLEVPIVDITPHPEYSRFGVGNSLTIVKLLRPMKSNYMIPICLPTVEERTRKKKFRYVFMVDYTSSVPTDFEVERMGKRTFKLYTHKECKKHRLRSRLTSEGVTHVLCSSGCGVRAGAPIASQTVSGAFELVGIAAGGAPCSRRSMRQRLNDEPPLYVDVYPYVNWVVNVITAFVLPKPYPHTFRRTGGGTSMGVKTGFMRKMRPQRQGWKARTYVQGNLCFRSLKRQTRISSMFYSERFEAVTDTPSKITLHLMVSAGIETTITCVKLLLPNRLMLPEITGTGGYNITIKFQTSWFPATFYFSLGLMGTNTTMDNLAQWVYEKKAGFH